MTSRADADVITAKVQGRRGTVVKVETQTRREPAAVALRSDLPAAEPPTRATPCRAAHTLTLAQSLYEKTFITYPRTASRHLSSSLNRELQGHVEATSISPYLPFIHTILARGSVSLTSRHVDDTKVTDHHAIIPATQRVDPAGTPP